MDVNMLARIPGKRTAKEGTVRLEQEVSAAMGAKVLERFPAGAPRGSWPAEEYAARRRAEGQPATVVMDLKSDAFLVVVPTGDDE
ncbi:hypothetical protein ABZ614_19830 [Streptomyces sp. NPDC013178]|uniref:hypothetical protein n=1 Tax=unclassified Streptomyces TaxID=2593676 RepID=UPI0033E60ADE